MSEALFVEFYSLEFKTDSSADRRCAAVLPGRDRCSQLFSLDSASKLHALHGKLHDHDHDHDDEIDNAARAHILWQIAKLSLCEAHAQDRNITAAVLQWESQIQSRVRVRPADPQTPLAKTVKKQSQIVFTDYTSEKSKIKPDNPMHIDRQVRGVLGRKIENRDKEASHLYVFSCEGAEGLYKVGVGQYITRVIEQGKCYSGLKLHCFVECPNAKMFESVVHEEFRQYRRKHMCTHCMNKKGNPVQHEEWLQAPLRDILDSVTAWSLYSRMLYGDGLSIDRNYQNLPAPGFLSRPDRWRRWALAETMRWMDTVSSQVALVPEIPKATEIKGSESESESESEYESASEAASVFSGHGGPSDTPGTTPDITPLTNPESLDDKRDYYSLSPVPAKKNTGSADLPGENEEDEGEWANSHQHVERALFTSPDFKKPIVPHSTIENNAANLDANDASHTSSTDTPLASSTSVDDGVRRVLEEITQQSGKPGTIYLTPPHPEKESFKLYFRRKGVSRDKECYSITKSHFEIECTNTQAIKKLVLAEFDGRTHTGTCGTGGCSTKHRDWINAPGKDIEASLRAWTALMKAGYKRIDIPGENLSRGADRWRKWAMEMAGKGKEEDERKAATKVEKQPA
ncbi:hypothetical protein BDW67DRAFT_186774 [Aspergillus spinulosporus]